MWKLKYKEAGKDSGRSEQGSPGLSPTGREKKAKAPTNIETLKIDEDYLITYREFMDALRSLKDTLYKTIMPRQLNF